ncbi:hypothetical protein IQ07DRAFT_381434 [Pyrenochaeta sp. DS3sAY3a]|nr:hypothetical protein IQ07DRAFT_381434 [Pyrenochaeta sp. DS3sAY3a]
MAKGQPLGSDQSTAQRGPWHWMRAMTLSIPTPGGGALTRVLLLAFDPGGLPQSAQGFLEPHCKAMHKRPFEQAAPGVYVFRLQRRALDQRIPYIKYILVRFYPSRGHVCRYGLVALKGGPQHRLRITPPAPRKRGPTSGETVGADLASQGACRYRPLGLE